MTTLSTIATKKSWERLKWATKGDKWRCCHDGDNQEATAGGTRCSAVIQTYCCSSKYTWYGVLYCRLWVQYYQTRYKLYTVRVFNIRVPKSTISTEDWICTSKNIEAVAQHEKNAHHCNSYDKETREVLTYPKLIKNWWRKRLKSELTCWMRMWETWGCQKLSSEDNGCLTEIVFRELQ